MRSETYWEKALKQTRISITKNSLYPLETTDLTREFYDKSDFVIRKLDTSRFKKNNYYGPKQNPFSPWDKILEIDKIGTTHQLILNKYPVQKGHILLITNNWMPQNGWLDINDWVAIQKVNNDTTGLWFFNSSPIAGASQPHRHFQLLRRSQGESSCPRENWFRELTSNNYESKLKKSIAVADFNFFDNPSNIYNLYLELMKKIGLGDPIIDEKPKNPYNILITDNWISIIKRRQDHVHGFSINGLGFAGYILITEKSNINYLKKYGPVKLLENFV